MAGPVPPDAKGKAKEYTLSQTYSLPVVHDPLNPLSSITRSATTASLTRPVESGSDVDSTGRPLRRSRTSRAARPSIGAVFPPEPTAQLVRSPTILDAMPEIPEHHSLHRPISLSSFSTAASGSGSNAHSNATTAAEPSLQQLLQSVDLSAALKLVQTIQQTQSASKPPPPQPPAAVRFDSHPAPPATVPALVPPRTGLPTPPEPYRRFSSPRRSLSVGTSGRSESEDVAGPLPGSPASAGSGADARGPLLQTGIPLGSIPPARVPPGPHAHLQANGVGIDDGKHRRRSLSAAFGSTGRRSRAASATSAASTGTTSSSTGLLAKVLDRGPDERNVMSEFGREFEDQISRVHLTLSLATLKRAQNAAKYLQLRYLPLYAALAERNQDGRVLANPLAVAHWRHAAEEQDQKLRRQHRSASNSVGKVINGVTPSMRALIPSYGPRRNAGQKHKSVWEVYPDEIVDYVAAGGKVCEDEDSPSGSGTPDKGEECDPRLDQLFGGGASLRNAISRITTRGTHNSSDPDTSARPSSTVPTSPREIKYGDHLLTGRPGHSRQLSIEGGSPLGRSPTRGATSARSRSSSLAGSLTGPGASSLLRASSLASTASLPLRRSAYGAASLDPTGNRNSPPIGSSLLEPFSSPKQSSKASLELPSPQHSPEMRRELMFGSPLQSHSTNALNLRNVPQTGGSLRNNISKRLDHLRGRGTSTDWDANSDGIASRNRHGTIEPAGWATAENASDNDFISPQSNSIRRTSRFSPSVGNLSDTGGPGFRRPRFRNRPSFDGGTMSSGGEEAKWRPHRALLGALSSNRVGEGIKSVTVTPKTELGIEGIPARRRLLRGNEQGEVVVEQLDEVDLTDDEYDKLVDAMHDLEVDADGLDAFVPEVPSAVRQLLDQLSSHHELTTQQGGMHLDFVYPRLTGSVMATIARATLHSHSTNVPANATIIVEEADSASPTSDTDSDTSSPPSDNDGRFRVPPRTIKHAASAGLGKGSPIKRRHETVTPVGSPRRVTDPKKQSKQVRPRSHTLGGPLLGLGRSVALNEVDERLTHQHHTDPIWILERSLAELDKLVTLVRAQVQAVTADQELVANEIQAGIPAVDAIQKAIESSGSAQFHRLEDDFLRLRTMINRPSARFDWVWAVGAAVAAGVFRLVFLLVVLLRLVKLVPWSVVVFWHGVRWCCGVREERAPLPPSFTALPQVGKRRGAR